MYLLFVFQVIRLFKVWQCRYLECVQQHEEHEAYIRRRVVEYGRHWKKQAQKARGRQLQQVFRNRQVRKLKEQKEIQKSL